MLLDEYERGMTSARIDQVFAEVRDGLVPLIALLREKGSAPDNSWLTNEGISYNLDAQAALCRCVCQCVCRCRYMHTKDAAVF